MQPSDGVSAFPSEDNIFHWSASLTGPSSTVYESQTYKLSITFPSDYPYSSPTIKFTTGIWHPNIDLHGNICLDILKEKWSGEGWKGAKTASEATAAYHPPLYLTSFPSFASFLSASPSLPQPHTPSAQF